MVATIFEHLAEVDHVIPHGLALHVEDLVAWRVARTVFVLALMERVSH